MFNTPSFVRRFGLRSNGRFLLSQNMKQSTTSVTSRPSWAVKSSSNNNTNDNDIANGNFANNNSINGNAPASVSTNNPANKTMAMNNSNNRTLEEVFTRNLGDEPSSTTNDSAIDWSSSFHGIGTTQLSQRQIDILLQSLNPEDIEIKPDGLIYLPEIKYRRILNKSLGPGSWGLIPRGSTIVTSKLITREYALVVLGKLISVARGEQDYFNELGIPTATEGCKSNALMRCCKDLGIGSELWDPRFIRGFKKQYCEQVGVTHITTGKKKVIWKRKDAYIEYPWKK